MAFNKGLIDLIMIRISAKRILAIRNSILLNAIPILMEQGFERSPFASSLFGRNNLGDFTYDLARLSNSYLELITIHISKGDRWIKAYLNIFNLVPIPKTLSELSKINGIAFRLAPNNRTQMRLDIELPKRNFIDFLFPHKEYRLKSFYTHSGLIYRQCELENVLKYDFKNIELKIEMWHKVHTPKRTNWEGKPI